MQDENKPIVIGLSENQAASETDTEMTNSGLKKCRIILNKFGNKSRFSSMQIQQQLLQGDHPLKLRKHLQNTMNEASPRDQQSTVRRPSRLSEVETDRRPADSTLTAD